VNDPRRGKGAGRERDKKEKKEKIYISSTFPYLELYRIACVKDVAVADFIQFQGEAVHWQVNFIRLVQDWEIESISSFLELLYSINIKRYEKVRGVGSLPSLKVSR
jgi:hypothetical protein